MPSWMPRKLGLNLARKAIKKAIGNMEDYGLPKPDHEPLEAHPSVSGEFLTRAGCGDIKFKPNIKAFEGPNVRMVPAGAPNLFYMGLAQPLPTLVNFAEQQAKLVAAYLTGQYHLPSDAEQASVTAKDEDFYLGGYYASARHTIQVDFGHYCADLIKEIERGKARAKTAGNRLPVAAKADLVEA